MNIFHSSMVKSFSYISTGLSFCFSLLPSLLIPWPAFCQQTANAASKANSPQCKHTHIHTLSSLSLLRNMRAGSNSQAGKAVVDSNLDLAGLGYFYFPESHGEEGRRGGGEVGVCGGRLKSFYKCQTTAGDHGAAETHTHTCTHS